MDIADKIVRKHESMHPKIQRFSQMKKEDVKKKQLTNFGLLLFC